MSTEFLTKIKTVEENYSCAKGTGSLYPAALPDAGIPGGAKTVTPPIPRSTHHNPTVHPPSKPPINDVCVCTHVYSFRRLLYISNTLSLSLSLSPFLAGQRDSNKCAGLSLSRHPPTPELRRRRRPRTRDVAADLLLRAGNARASNRILLLFFSNLRSRPLDTAATTTRLHSRVSGLRRVTPSAVQVSPSFSVRRK